MNLRAIGLRPKSEFPFARPKIVPIFFDAFFEVDHYSPSSASRSISATAAASSIIRCLR